MSPPHSASERNDTGTVARHGPLLATLGAIVLFAPSLAEARVGAVIVMAMFAVLLAACATAIGEPNQRRILLILAGGVVAIEIAISMAPFPPATLAVVLLRCVFLAFVTGRILVTILREQDVSYQSLLGGVCVYLLIGLFFQTLFGAVELAWPGSFRSGETAVSAMRGADLSTGRFPALIYFSFVTLTTLGFGDIAPTWSLPRALVTAEAIVGQLYLTILVASLVGMHLAGRSGNSST